MFTGSIAADEYLYIDDFSAYPQQTITVPVKAHFDYFVSAFQIDLTLPAGMTVVGATAGSDMSISYVNEYGLDDVYNSRLYCNNDFTRYIAANQDGGYWTVNGSFEMYGTVKWDPGDYDEMFLIEIEVSSDFMGGDLVVQTQPSSGYDNRGPVCPRGQVFCKVATVRPYGSGTGDEPSEDPIVGFTMPDMTINNTNSIIIPVSMKNNVDIIAFQTDIYLPDGFEVAQSDGEYQVELSSTRMTDHTIMANILPNGAVRVLCYSPMLQPFTGSAGELFYIKVNLPEEAEGTYNILLKNSLVTNTSDSELALEDTSCELVVDPLIAGDANNSGSVTVSDVVVTAMFILNYDPSPFDFVAADMNGDGNISVTDVVIIARQVLNGTANVPMRLPAFGDVNDRMSASQLDIKSGETRTVSIMLDNEMDYTAFQFEMKLPDGLTASNFRMTDRAGNHSVDAVSIGQGKMRVLGYSPTLQSIEGNNGALITFDVTAMGEVSGNVNVDAIEMVTPNGQATTLDVFSFKVNGSTGVKNLDAATRIYSDGKNIVVESPVDTQVTVCDVLGRSQSVNVKAGRTVIPVNSGVYVVNANGITAKMSLR